MQETQDAVGGHVRFDSSCSREWQVAVLVRARSVVECHIRNEWIFLFQRSVCEEKEFVAQMDSHMDEVEQKECLA
eukprot:4982267-Amphidinium_carterae.2